jgi:hypothetical protein
MTVDEKATRLEVPQNGGGVQQNAVATHIYYTRQT